ncbi:MAG: tRNA threonylcarbamoyladenosine dehydratase [Bacteroidetes bacterium]|nr:tRNA threonylcarbamoyladenosine dehydratase [Bacteroidota bacterium]
MYPEESLQSSFEWSSRTVLLLGEEVYGRLTDAHVLVAGLGGVGAYAAEMLCRAGIGSMTIADGDIVEPGNRNRQLHALICNEGRPKAEVLAERFRQINPDLQLTVLNEFLKDKRIEEVLDEKYDYVVDAIDTLSPKVFLILQSLKNNLKIISSMGAGGKTDPSLVQVADISKSYNCGLAKIVRRQLHKRGIYSGFRVVFSPEPVIGDTEKTDTEPNKRTRIGTVSYMPAVFGCFCASVVIRELSGKTEN